MLDLLELLVFVVVGVAGLLQWWQKRKRHARPQATSTSPSAARPRSHLRRTLSHPLSQPTPQPIPHPTPSPSHSRQPTEDIPPLAEEESPQVSLEDLLSELFGGEPTTIPPRPPSRIPTPPPAPVLPTTTQSPPKPEPPPKSLAESLEPLVPAPATSPGPPPQQPTSHTLGHLHAANWRLAIILHELLSPPVSLR